METAAGGEVVGPVTTTSEAGTAASARGAPSSVGTRTGARGGSNLKPIKATDDTTAATHTQRSDTRRYSAITGSSAIAAHASRIVTIVDPSIHTALIAGSP